MLYTIYMWALIVSAVIVFGTTLAVLLPVARKGFLYNLIVRGWARTIVFCSGVKLNLVGFDRIDPDAPYVFMSNHQSYFDVICQVGYLPANVRFVAKKELVYLPIFGQVMWATGHVIVNRASHQNAVAEMKKAADKIRGGTSILIYPEGTRSPDHRLGEFKKGGFMLALEAKVPVVPISVVGTHPMMPKGGYTFKKSEVTMVMGDLIEVDEILVEDREKLMERVRAAIIDNFPEGTPEREANRSRS